MSDGHPEGGVYPVKASDLVALVAIVFLLRQIQKWAMRPAADRLATAHRLVAARKAHQS